MNLPTSSLRAGLLRVAAVRGELVRLVSAAALAGLTGYLIWIALPHRLNLRTDIVGYPTFYAFNINRYFWKYEVWVWFVPLATIALYTLFGRLAAREQPRPPRVPPVVADDGPRPAPAPWAVHAGAVARVLVVGAALGLELGIGSSHTTGWVHAVVAPYALICAALVTGLAVALARLLRRPFWPLLATVNTAAACLALVGLYHVSATTQVRVASDGAVHHYRFFPLWLALAGTAALVAWLAVSWRRSGALAAARPLERRAILVAVGPVALFPFVAILPGALGGMDMFHEGESLAAARLTREGAFPWRDLLFIHGPMYDIIRPLVGLKLFGDTRWGGYSGWTLIMIPLAWIALYALCAYLFRRNWLFLAGTQVAVVTGAVFNLDTYIRFLLVPVVLLLLIALLRRATPARAAAFVVVLAAQVILAPEAGIAAVALAVTLVCFELYYRDPARSLVENFRRTILCASSAAVVIAAWLAFLAAFGALGSYVFYYRTFAPGHQLTGGVPMPVADSRFEFAMVTPIVLFLLALSFFAVRMRFRLALRVEDWAIGGAALFMALYYGKFLARSDHVFEAFAVAVPVLFYTAYRATGLLTGRLPPRYRGAAVYVLTALAIAVTLSHAPVPLTTAVRAIPSHFTVTVPEEPSLARVGYAVPGAIDAGMVLDISQITSKYLGPKDTVFDFSNSPGLYYYLLRLHPATRYYHVSMAIRQRTQADVISELARRRPKLVVYASSSFGLFAWDGIGNPVRHYDVSQYLLEHYRPLLVSHGYLLMARDGSRLPPLASVVTGLSEQPVTDHLYLKAPACAWGDTPNFLTTGPSQASQARPLVLRSPSGKAGVLTLGGWAADHVAGKPAAEVVAAVGTLVVARIPVSGDRPDVATYFKQPGLRHSGFSAVIRLRPEWIAGLHLYGITRGGTATELAFGPGASWRPGPGTAATLTLPGGRSLEVVPDAVRSSVDAATLVGGPKPPLPFGYSGLIQFDPPAHPERYHWLEIETRTPLHATRFALSDRGTLGAETNSITFSTLGRGPRTVRVQIGACSQWRDYTGPLYLAMSDYEDVSAVRLLR